MRFKLLLISLMTLPLVVVAQEKHHKDVVFYNAGQMYVGVSSDLSAKEGIDETAYTTKDIRLYIGGSLKVVDNSKIKQRGGTALTGDFVAAGTGSPFVGNLIDNPVVGKTLSGVNLYQNNAIYFINDTLSVKGVNNTEDIYKPAGKVAFATGMALKQYIRREVPMTGTGDKETNVINFPNIVVGSSKTTNFAEAKSYLIVENDIAMTVPYVVVEPEAMFSVQTKPLNLASNVPWTAGNIGSSLMTAHIKWSHKGLPYDDEIVTSETALGKEFVEGGYGVARKYANPDSKTDPADWKWSYAQHDLRLYDPETPATNKRSGTGKDGKSKSMNYLYPFAPLMNELRSDYMTFNTQYILGKGSVTDLGDTNLDPKKIMGAATYIAMDLTDYDYDVIQDNPVNQNVKAVDRAVGGYAFSRKFLNVRPGFNFFTKAGTGVVSGGANPYIAEVINSKGEGESYNFPMDNTQQFGRFRVIGNNSFLPLDLTQICQPDGPEKEITDIKMYKLSSGKPSDFVNVIVGQPSATMYLRNRFWIPYNSVIYAERNPGSQPIGGPQTPTVNYFYIDYFEAQSTGGTATLTGENFLLAPMQLALVQIGNKAGAYSGISLGSNLFKHKNAITAKSVTSLNARRDEVLLQIINEETGKEDRTVVVLREDGKLDGTNTYDSKKQTPVSNLKVGVEATELTKTTDIEVQAMIEGTIYTQASTGDRMSTNIIPSSIAQLPLYVVPPVSTPTEFTITPYRLETMQAVDEVWLEDKYTNTFTLLTSDTKYKFQADPLIGDEAAKNRFVLHFGKVAKDEVIIGDNDSDISCYYTNNTLYIRGLNSKDVGSDVRVFDMQGRLMGNTKITNVPVDTYSKSLVSGAYIVKISGARNYTTKLLNLQH